MTQTAISYIFMRAGTSRGPYFNSADLPSDRQQLAQVLIHVLGSGHPLNIDGIGGGNAVTTKVAILSQSDDPWADIDYFFAQVSVEDQLVDFKPTCGNILSGVASAAVEMGLIQTKAGTQDCEVKIRSVNTGAKVVARIQTQDHQVRYNGVTMIDGVPGTAAPVELNFMQVAGSSTGAFLPTGNLQDEFDDISVTCMDVAMPMVIARAQSFGLSGQESRTELDDNRDFFKRMEAVRMKAGAAMGLGDVQKSVTPKFGLLAPAQNGGSAAARYFMPWQTHPTMAVTGSQCMASCLLTKGTIADGLITPPEQGPAKVILEHPMGSMDVIIDFERKGGEFIHKSAGLVRTCRKLAQGHVFIPKQVWDGTL